MSLSATMRVVDGWVEVTNSLRKPHEKEHAEAWLDRLLGLPPGSFRAFRLSDAGAEIRAGSGPSRLADLPATRLEVLRSLDRRARGLLGATDRQRGDGGAVVLCDEARSWFLLTRKDEWHPNPRCRGRLALVSGALEPGETFREGALRELSEEVRDLPLVDAAAARLQPLTTTTLEAVQWPGTYRLGVFLAAAPTDRFAQWRAAWAAADVLSEASPLCLDRAALLAAIAAEHANPGSQFVGSHHVLSLALGAGRG